MPREILRVDALGKLKLPAFATAHSHAFQRGLRGRAQRKTRSGNESFWSWRDEMYALAESLTPETIASISRVAFRELYRAGVRTVGEFHYVHHDRGGVPYAERTVLSDAVISAARAEGLRIALLRVAYQRGGYDQLASGPQLRFADPSVDDVLRDVDALRAKYAGDPGVRIGIAPHSVRAVSPSWIRELAGYAKTHDLPLHVHVAEQRREVEECLAETGLRPVALLAREGALGPRFTAVHATHLATDEARLLGETKSGVCIAGTTERDLGDGLPDLTALREAGVTLSVGIDSHVLCDPFEEMRALELHERLRTETRLTFQDSEESPAASLWRAASHDSARAVGFDDAGEELTIDRAHPTLELVREADLLDAIVFSGSCALLV